MAEEQSETRQADQAQARHLHAFLRAAILFGALGAGTVVSIGVLVRRHRVSRRAAREALTSLEDEGLVRREGGDSAVVAPAKGRPGRETG